MKRFAMMLAVVVGCGVGTASAQTTASDEGRLYAEFTLGATLGHTSDLSIGAEGGYRLGGGWDVFAEAGHMGNITSTDVEARGQQIAAHFGATANVIVKANFFDAGARYRLPAVSLFRPYAAIGFGFARVTPQTAFFIGGTDVTSQLADQVTLGADLADTTTKGLVTIGFGADLPWLSRYLVDISYRYGRILANTGAIARDTGTNTNRVQVGIGVRF